MWGVSGQPRPLQKWLHTTSAGAPTAAPSVSAAMFQSTMPPMPPMQQQMPHMPHMQSSSLADQAMAPMRQNMIRLQQQQQYMGSCGLGAGVGFGGGPCGFGGARCSGGPTCVEVGGGPAMPKAPVRQPLALADGRISDPGDGASSADKRKKKKPRAPSSSESSSPRAKRIRKSGKKGKAADQEVNNNYVFFGASMSFGLRRVLPLAWRSEFLNAIDPECSAIRLPRLDEKGHDFLLYVRTDISPSLRVAATKCSSKDDLSAMVVREARRVDREQPHRKLALCGDIGNVADVAMRLGYSPHLTAAAAASPATAGPATASAATASMAGAGGGPCGSGARDRRGHGDRPGSSGGSNASNHGVQDGGADGGASGARGSGSDGACKGKSFEHLASGTLTQPLQAAHFATFVERRSTRRCSD